MLQKYNANSRILKSTSTFNDCVKNSARKHGGHRYYPYHLFDLIFNIFPRNNVLFETVETMDGIKFIFNFLLFLLSNSLQ